MKNLTLQLPKPQVKKCKRGGSESFLFMVQLSCFYVHSQRFIVAFGVFPGGVFGSNSVKSFTGFLFRFICGLMWMLSPSSWKTFMGYEGLG